MLTNDPEPTSGKAGGFDAELPHGLPTGSAAQQIAFLTNTDDDQPVLMEFHGPRKCRAVLTAGHTGEAGGLVILMIPVTSHDDPDLLAKARDWVEAATAGSPDKSLMLTLQGAHIVWSPGRAAALAQADRIELVRAALIEFTFHETELREIEREIGQGWPALEEDSPLAFDFNERALQRREVLGRRFQQMLALRARLARLTPHLHRPSIHPPTLASQIGERLRERTRMLERLEFLGEQLEVFERVYEMCGQRASEYTLTRKGHTLEMIIIVLLAAQTILHLIELLASMGE